MADLRAVLTVASIATGCALALALTDLATRGRIAENEAARARAAIDAVLPAEAGGARLPDFGEPGTWRLCNGFVLVHGAPRGYGGPIHVLLSYQDPPSLSGNRNGQGPALRGLAVISHTETPGFADFLSDPAWIGRLIGRDAEALSRVDVVTGATITSRALLDFLAQTLADPKRPPEEAASEECNR